MKLSPKYRTKKLGMIYTIFGSFCSFLIEEGMIFCPKSGIGESRRVKFCFIVYQQETTRQKYVSYAVVQESRNVPRVILMLASMVP